MPHADAEGKPSYSRAFATRIEDVPFLNVREVGPNEEKEWTLIAYALPDADQLSRTKEFVGAATKFSGADGKTGPTTSFTCPTVLVSSAQL